MEGNALSHGCMEVQAIYDRNVDEIIGSQTSIAG